ncbi:riboflavin synthase alpha chain [Alkalispirillum mobile]|uniref:Riboflavin synthase n=1 Tax=Alkalispirillum mobile TaxID=85925 RepID=A0A498CDK0_9GAMM|nr:riboflavin synthase [Alkalispirillum mobile]RLK51370.1 riboflavin synthase alpha chain [Alkalispirillum mobile]
MFTGIVQAVGRIQRRDPRGEDMRLWIATDGLDLGGAALGDSIAVNGVCLTAVELQDGAFAADVSVETLRLTSLGDLGEGDAVNLELALTLQTPLGGHLVSGHVDGLGEVVSRVPAGRSEVWRFRAPEGLARYIAAKGSITVDGVSLTVNAVDGRDFEVNLVPHTLEVTRLGQLRPGSRVNLEVDIIARYLERLLTAGGTGGEGLTRDFLEAHGFGRVPGSK